MRVRIHRRLQPLVWLLLGLLAGCGNAIEHFDIGSWQPAGEPGRARYARGETIDVDGNWLQELTPGSGREIALGDAVALEAEVTSTDRQGKVTVSAPKQLWLYTGFEGSLESWGDERGWLGEPRLRARVVGLKEGSTLELSDTGVGVHEVRIPTKMFRNANLARFQGIERGPELTLSTRSEWATGNRIESRLRVLETCPARLYKRTSIVTQWGYVLLPGSGKSYPMSRRGELYWGGLLVNCPRRAQPLWFQSGPGVGAGMRGGNAFDIEHSFESGHRRLFHASDWRGDISEAEVPAELREVARRSLPEAASPPPGVQSRGRAASSTAEIEKKILDIDEGRAPPSR